MTIFLIISYLLLGFCMFSAVPAKLPAWKQISASILWPMTLITSIFSKIIN